MLSSEQPILLTTNYEKSEPSCKGLYSGKYCMDWYQVSYVRPRLLIGLGSGFCLLITMLFYPHPRPFTSSAHCTFQSLEELGMMA
jgi:hypothetical protein